MKTPILLLYLASILFSAVMAFIYRKEIKSRRLSILVPYLFLVFLQELCIFFYLRHSPGTSTGIIYNIYHPVTVIIFAVLYYNIPFNIRFRKAIIVLAITNTVLTIIAYCFITSFFRLNSYLSVVAGFVITCYAILFLFNYFSLDNSEEEKHWRPLIVITIGLVAFYPVIGISFAYQKQLLNLEATISGLKLYQLIPQVMSVFMYACFSYAFYLCKKKN